MSSSLFLRNYYTTDGNGSGKLLHLSEMKKTVSLVSEAWLPLPMDECKQYNSNADLMYSLGLESVIDKSMKDGETNLRL